MNADLRARFWRLYERHKIPFLGICLGLQAAGRIRSPCSRIGKANSTEFEQDCEHPVIALISEWTTAAGTTEVRDENSDQGAPCAWEAKYLLESDSMTHRCYRQNEIVERHRHRYEFNNDYLKVLSDAGLKLVGKSADGMLVEVVEVPDHPWFVGCQFHPEFTSTPREGHPLFSGFIEAAVVHNSHQSVTEAAAVDGVAAESASA